MNDLAKYRIDDAKERLRSAQLLYENGLYKDSLSRSYYAIFNATRAVLAEESVDFKKHSAVISYFTKEYIKTGRIDAKYSDILRNSFQIRNNSEYDSFYIATQNDAKEQVENAEIYIKMIEEYLAIQMD